MKRFIPLALLLVLVGAGSVSARVLMPTETQASQKYVEIVREDRSCTTGACFVEYLLLGNGAIMFKSINAKAFDEIMPVFELRHAADPAKQSALFDYLVTHEGDMQTGESKLTDPFNIYFYPGARGARHLAWSSKEESAFFVSAFKQLADIFDAAKPDGDFYLHEYYQPLTGGTQALHIFGDGTVIASVFDRKSYTMLSTGMFSLEEDSLAKVREMATKAQTAPRAKHMTCAKETGLEYGLVEFMNLGAVQKSYTCGTGSGDIPALFNYVRQLAQ